MNTARSRGELRRLFDLVCDLPPDARRARLAAEGAEAAVVAEIESLLAAEGTLDMRARAPVAGMLDDIAGTELGPGDRLGAWRLREKLASGGMGTVFLADRADGHFEQQAAIKLIRGVAEADTLARFARERQILASLQHPHIARLLDGGATPGGQPYLVMEYVDGEPIDAYCARANLQLEARLDLFRLVCEAVEFAHRRLIVHCDLKPSNVLVRADGFPVLLDFGIARALDRKRADPADGRYFTPGYASPEQLRGEPLTTAVDVYALGLILFELIAGRKARVDTADETVNLLERAEVRPSELATDVAWRVGADLDAIVLHATAERPESRYASAQAIAADVRRFLQHRTVEARPQTWRYRAARAVRRRWPLVLAALAIVFISAGFTWRLLVENTRARLAERDARQQAATAERVGDFLVSVFNVSNPKLNVGGRDVTAREILDQGAQRIDVELADEPQVRARLLDVLATAYRHLGVPRPSADLFQRAIELYLDPRIDRPLDAAAALSQLAVVYANSSHPPDDTLAVARRSLELRLRHAPDDDKAMADSWNTLGVVLEANVDLDGAQDALLKALALREKGVDRLAHASTLHNLGLVAKKRGDVRAALEYYERALDLKRELTGERSVDFQSSLLGYATTIAEAGERERAIPLLERNLALCIELYGRGSSNAARANNELGAVLHDLGRFRDASARYEEAMRIHAEIGGEGGVSQAVPLNNLASAYEDMGDFATAIPLFRRSLQARTRTHADDSPMVLRARHNLARVLTEAGLLDEAKPALDRAVADVRAHFGDDDANTVKSMLVLAEWQLRAGDDAAAARTLAGLSSAADQYTPRMRARRDALEARIASAHGDRVAAREHWRTAWETMRNALGEQHPYAADFALGYAAALADDGHEQQARDLVTPLMSMIEATFVATAPQREALRRWRDPPRTGRRSAD